MIELDPEPFGPFPQSVRLTEAGDVTLVPLPGHTPGQIGVLVDEGDHAVFLAGDSSYTQELMLRGKPDGVGADEQAERLTHEQIRAFAAETPTVYLGGAALLPTLARRAVRKGVDDNLATLKHMLEAGRPNHRPG
jgi:N-acyl homoserine lactone hydrolase